MGAKVAVMQLTSLFYAAQEFNDVLLVPSQVLAFKNTREEPVFK